MGVGQGLAKLYLGLRRGDLASYVCVLCTFAGIWLLLPRALSSVQGGTTTPVPLHVGRRDGTGGLAAMPPPPPPPPPPPAHLQVAKNRLQQAIYNANMLAAERLPTLPKHQDASREEVLAKQQQSPEEMQKEKNEGYHRNAFNQYVSDRISLHRAIPETRNPDCSKIPYPVESLPTTTVIIPFHNEARTTLLRTAWSVLDRSPERLIAEIILVDDASTGAWLGKVLDDEVATMPKTWVLRLKKRSGLIRAKTIGADHAKGDVLTFLDSHCECNDGWLEPLLERIRIDRRNVVCPVIDGIDKDSFKYSGSPDVSTRGIFTWSLTFSWMEVPYAEAAKRHGSMEPLRSPTMAGGLFSMDKSYFYEIGTYDLGMDVWGGENLEMSFRIWMCGGTLEFVPCSRVGHVYRMYHPYKFPNGTGETINRNLNRVAEVWMDEYKEIYYSFRPSHRRLGTGDISSRIALRKDLKCKTFDWYLKNVFPDGFVPDREHSIAHGSLRNARTSQCLHTKTSKESDMKPELMHCQERFIPALGDFYLTKLRHEILTVGSFSNRCLDFSKMVAMAPTEFFGCHGLKGNQEWRHTEEFQIMHKPSSLCLESIQKGAGYAPTMNTCQKGNPAQEWRFSEYDAFS